MPANLEANLDINKFYETARKDIKSLLTSVNGAAIYNASGSNVTFYVYNYSDGVNLIEAHHFLVAPDYYGTAAASGKFYKVMPNKNKDEEFLVAPNKAYIYRGPGKIEEVK